MSKRKPEIAACPFCGGECVTNEFTDSSSLHWAKYYWFAWCPKCKYFSGRHRTEAAAIRAHNAVASRLDPGHILRVLGGMKGQFMRRWSPDKWIDQSIIEAVLDNDKTKVGILDDVMKRIRTMSEPKQ
jgi:hypothetical protein|tara:strand:+ start:1654 stop:2037 length:384 start_codon:yes stop_codon:yes gene_type:complete